jgi:phosphate transport system protein
MTTNEQTTPTPTTGARPGLAPRIGGIEAQVSDMATATRRMLVDASIAVQTADAGRARAVVGADDAVDAAYLEIERTILDVIARQQPVAGDLRRLVALLQTGLHLERMADTTVEIARQVLRTGESSPTASLGRDLVAMSTQVRRMLDEATHALRERRRDLCLSVVRLEGELDEVNEALFTELAASAGQGLALPSVLWVDRVARLLQRAGQHAVDIAEAAWFQITGELREFDRDDGDLDDIADRQSDRPGAEGTSGPTAGGRGPAR